MHQRGNLSRSVHHNGVWDYVIYGEPDWTPFGKYLEAEIGYNGEYTGWLRQAGAGQLREYTIWHFSSEEKRLSINWPRIREENLPAA